MKIIGSRLLIAIHFRVVNVNNCDPVWGSFCKKNFIAAAVAGSDLHPNPRRCSGRLHYMLRRL
jgi:hypothetical protein